MKKKTRKEEQPAESPRERNGVVRMMSLDQLAGVCREPIVVRLLSNGKVVEVEAFRLTVDQEEERLAIMRKYTAPMITKGPDGRPLAKPEYDPQNPEFLEKVEKQMRLARAVAAYRACPCLQVPEPLSHEQIQRRLEEHLTDGVLNGIYQVLLTQDISLAERANFTTAPDLSGS